MSEAMLVAIVAGIFALVSGLVSASAALAARHSKKKWEATIAELIRTHRNVSAFHRLEELYGEALATPERTAKSWKKSIRLKLRDSGYKSPTKGATSLESEQRIERLSEF